MRYTKAALLMFGVGLVLGFIVVVGEFPEWERTAAAIMAFGLVSLPFALFADGNGMVLLRGIVARFSRRKPKRRRTKSGSSATRRKAPAGARAPRRKPG